MLYRIRHTTPKQFTPVEVTFVIQTEEEMSFFHNHVAIHIAEASKFIGDVYRVEESQGVVPLKNTLGCGDRSFR